MKEQMTSKERLMTAIAGGIPDRVPAIPDFSNMIPAKMTGKPFWEIYLNDNPSLYRAYVAAARYYGIDGWYQAYDAVTFQQKGMPEPARSIVSRAGDRIVERFDYHTPAGDLWQQKTYMVADPPTTTVKLIKDFERDFPKIRYFFGDVEHYDASLVPEYRALCGDSGIFTFISHYPGMHWWLEFFDGSLEAATYAYYDYPDLFDEWTYLMDRETLRKAEILISQKPDVLLLGGSGTLTLANPAIVRKHTLPTIQKVCRMAKQAGVLTMLHSCGKSMAFLDMLANETELNCINPLEGPPMGDVNLAEVKRLYGKKLSLMGNLNTTSVMLMGSPEDVERAARQAIDDAGEDGGFLLSTGDQCGRDTPEANLFKLVEVAKTYGRY
jgi:uroporphyrinogen decarboxylase